jgi:hypothetical protein
MSETIAMGAVDIKDAAAFLDNLRTKPGYSVLPSMRDFERIHQLINTTATEVIAAKRSGFIWISPGTLTCFIEVKKPKDALWSMAFLKLIGGGYVERCQGFVEIGGKPRKVTILVDEEGLLKRLRHNYPATLLTDGRHHLVGEALVSIGSTGWNM